MFRLHRTEASRCVFAGWRNAADNKENDAVGAEAVPRRDFAGSRGGATGGSRDAYDNQRRLGGLVVHPAEHLAKVVGPEADGGHEQPGTA